MLGHCMITWDGQKARTERLCCLDGLGRLTSASSEGAGRDTCGVGKEPRRAAYVPAPEPYTGEVSGAGRDTSLGAYGGLGLGPWP